MKIGAIYDTSIGQLFHMAHNILIAFIILFSIYLLYYLLRFNFSASLFLKQDIEICSKNDLVLDLYVSICSRYDRAFLLLMCFIFFIIYIIYYIWLCI